MDHTLYTDVEEMTSWWDWYYFYYYCYYYNYYDYLLSIMSTNTTSTVYDYYCLLLQVRLCVTFEIFAVTCSNFLLY